MYVCLLFASNHFSHDTKEQVNLFIKMKNSSVQFENYSLVVAFSFRQFCMYKERLLCVHWNGNRSMIIRKKRRRCFVVYENENQLHFNPMISA